MTTVSTLRQGGEERGNVRPDGDTKDTENSTPARPVKSKIVLGSQNFNGFRNELKREELVLQMRRYGIDLLCGQESAMPTSTDVRWDTEEIFLNFGYDRKRQDGTYVYKKAGCVFVMSKEWGGAFIRGGKKVKRYTERLVTITIPTSSGRNVYIVNAHFPDSSHKVVVIRAFQRKFEAALAAAAATDIVICAGDCNCSLGTATDEDDRVCGTHGLPHQNLRGRELKHILAMHEMSNLVSQQPQNFDGTWTDPRSGLPHQLDYFFMKQADAHIVQKCINAPMLVNSDHDSLRLHLNVKKPPKPARTNRQLRRSRDLGANLGTDGVARN